LLADDDALQAYLDGHKAEFTDVVARVELRRRR
jgi:hypothetical protein